MNRFRRFLHWGPIIALGIIAFLFVCAVLADIIWYPPDTWIGVFHLACFCSWVVLILRNFFKAVLDGPGYVPVGWRPVNKIFCASIFEYLYFWGKMFQYILLFSFFCNLFSIVQIGSRAVFEISKRCKRWKSQKLHDFRQKQTGWK